MKTVTVSLSKQIIAISEFDINVRALIMQMQKSAFLIYGSYHMNGQLITSIILREGLIDKR